MSGLAASLWSADRSEEALLALARRARLVSRRAAVALVPARDEEPLRRAMRAAEAAAFEVEAVAVERAAVDRLLAACAPALLTVESEGVTGLVAVLRGGRRRLALLGPDGRIRRVAQAAVFAGFLGGRDRKAAARAEDLLAAVPLAARRRRRAVEHLTRQAGLRLEGCLLLGETPAAPWGRQLLRAGVIGDTLRFAGAYAAGYAVLLGSWWILGAGVLAGRVEAAWLLAWALTLLATLPFRAISIWARARLAVGFGTLLKRRLLEGALRLGPDEARHAGLGHFLGRVLEAEAVETLTLQGGVLVVVAAIELAFSSWVLAQGGSPAALTAGLAAWTAVALALAAGFSRRRLDWTLRRLDMSHDLIERLLGHRTRLAQEARLHWHADEDEALSAYHRDSQAFDRWKAVLLTLVPRGWLLLGVALLLPSFLAGDGPEAALAVGVGGTLAAHRGFVKLSEGLSHLAGAVIAWRQVARLAAAAASPAGEALGATVPAAEGERRAEGVLDAHELRYRHAGRSANALDGVSLRIAPGDRVLLEGRSGGGKSTLVALLSVLRPPRSGLLLLDGLDASSLGADAWRRRVVAVPQLHENHVFAGSLALNLLLGRGWPPTAEDLAAAEEVCRELGLGDLLDRMPGGLQQYVGESGWRLSHGEASRLFLARALLQDGDVLLLDESFAALDPASLGVALDCVERRARSVVVVAHP